MGPQQGARKAARGMRGGAKKERRAAALEAQVRYAECRKNHAASIGGYAVDGCREFMAAGEEGTEEALRCAACSCHRSFHRREAAAEREELWDCSSHSGSPA